ncbi:MAG: hypothetical protein HZA24_00945 [Nitrospirae bacterium]|nr:hypothetical protein [Nitrospirota bacterium]
MAMIRFAAFTPTDHETVKVYEAAVAKDPGHIDPKIAEEYRILVKENFGKLMSTMIGEIARFFDIAIKRKVDWNGYYGWTFSYHGDTVCWYGISYSADKFLATAFGVKCGTAPGSAIDAMVAGEGYRKVPFGRDNAEWAVKEFRNEVYHLTEDNAQMEFFSKIAEDQLDLLEM